MPPNYRRKLLISRGFSVCRDSGEWSLSCINIASSTLVLRSDFRGARCNAGKQELFIVCSVLGTMNQTV